MSNGLTVKKSECTSTLQNKNIQEFILELEYAHSTNNFILERLVMEEYYKKQSKKLLD